MIKLKMRSLVWAWIWYDWCSCKRWEWNMETVIETLRGKITWRDREKAASYKPSREAWKDLSFKNARWSQHCWHLWLQTFNLPNRETIHFCYLILPVCGALLQKIYGIVHKHKNIIKSDKDQYCMISLVCEIYRAN